MVKIQAISRKLGGREVRIQHNITGINAYRNIGISQNNTMKSLEKLSSGYVVNRAGDGAAELAISEGMRSKIRGLEQAEGNIEDGINLVHVAEGAMQEVHFMLNRMMTLCTKASNGIYTDIDRDCVQEEVDELQDEIQRITDSTEFAGMKLFPTEPEKGVEEAVIAEGTGLPAWVAQGAAFGVGKLTENYTAADQLLHAAATLDFSALTEANVAQLIGTGFYTTCFTCDAYYSIQFVSGTGTSMERSGIHYIYNVGVDNVTTAKELIERIIEATDDGNPNDHFTMFSYYKDASGVSDTKLVIYDERDAADINATSCPDRGKVGSGVAYSDSKEELYDIVLQIGSEEGETLKVQLPNISLSDLRLSGSGGVSCLTQERANRSIRIMQRAINTVSMERGRMGAYENRLEHAYNSLAVAKENITAAESRIRDTDMAKEIVSYTRNNILAQAAQAMMTQANAIPDVVLRLLQG